MSYTPKGPSVEPLHLKDAESYEVYKNSYNSTWNNSEIRKSLFESVNLDKTIRCKVIRSHPIFDSSFGNRIYRWVNAYYLSEATNFEHKIVLQQELWPELLFLTLPHTFTKSSQDFDFDFETNTLYSQINEDQYIDVVLNKNKDFLNKNNHCVLSEWFICSNNLNGVKLDEISTVNPFNEIKFQFEEINEYFNNKFKDFIGIHIRRYKGIKTKEGDFEEIPENLRDDYKKEYTECEDLSAEAYPFIADKEYYRFIDTVLMNNPDQCFYISTDLPLKFYSYYKEKYKNIFCFHDFRDEFLELLKKHYPNIILSKLDHIINYLFDFFAYSSSKIMVLSAHSSWGRVCEMRRPLVPTIKLPLSRFAPHLKYDQIYAELIDLFLNSNRYEEMKKLPIGGGSYNELLLSIRSLKNKQLNDDNVIILHDDFTFDYYDVENNHKFKIFNGKNTEKILKDFLRDLPD